MFFWVKGNGYPGKIQESNVKHDDSLVKDNLDSPVMLFGLSMIRTHTWNVTNVKNTQRKSNGHMNFVFVWPLVTFGHTNHAFLGVFSQIQLTVT